MIMNHHFMICFHLTRENNFQHCINVLLFGIYKYLNGMSPELINKVFYLCLNHSNLCNLNVFAANNARNKFILNATVFQRN